MGNHELLLSAPLFYFPHLSHLVFETVCCLFVCFQSTHHFSMSGKGHYVILFPLGCFSTGVGGGFVLSERTHKQDVYCPFSWPMFGLSTPFSSEPEIGLAQGIQRGISFLFLIKVHKHLKEKGTYSNCYLFVPSFICYTIYSQISIENKFKRVLNS